MSLVKQDGLTVKPEAVLCATKFLLALQNWDGGWGAFKVDNDSHVSEQSAFQLQVLYFRPCDRRRYWQSA